MSILQQTPEKHTLQVPQTHFGTILTQEGRLVQSAGLFIPKTFQGDSAGLLRLLDTLSPLYGHNPAKLVGGWAVRPLATDKTPFPISNAAPLFENEGCDVIIHPEPTLYADVLAIAGKGALRGFETEDDQ